MEERYSNHDIIFNLLLIIGVLLCFIFSLILLFSPLNTKAATQLREVEVTNNIYPYTSQCSGGQRQFCAYSSSNNQAYTFNVNSAELFNTNSIMSFMFKVNYGFYSDAPTTLTIEFNDNIVNNGNYTCGIETTDGYVISCTASRISSNKMNINFYTTSGATGLYQFWVSNSSGINATNYFGIAKVVSYQTTGSDNSDIINNDNQNTTDIINNANTNTQSIIDKLAESGLQELNSQRQQLKAMCKNNYYTPISIGKAISGGALVDRVGSFYTEDFIPINKVNLTEYSSNNKLYINEPPTSTGGYYFVFYNSSKSLIDAYYTSTQEITIPSGAAYFRFNSLSPNTTIFRYSSECIESGDEIYSYLKNDDIDDDLGEDFFSDFTEDDHGGISGIVTRPLIIVNNLLSNNNRCDNLNLPEFMTVSNAYLPSGCIFWNNVPTAGVTVWNIFVCGFCSYIILVDLFHLIQKVKDPMTNVVEVMKL